MSTPSQAPPPPSGASTKKTQVDPLIGTPLAGKYDIQKKLGEGGMGSVYLAKQRPIDRLVAVKVLLGKLAEDEVAVRRFEQEAKAVSKMQHPNTVTIYDYGQTEDNRLYIVMEFLKGKALSDVLRTCGVLEPGRAIHIIKQVCASLADAHAAGIIHRDLKPDNIFLTEVGGDKDWVKVLDFGVAKLADNEAGATLTQTGMIFGTPKYMSPEQAEGRPIDYRADIYAIGVVLYELLVGRPPFLADTPVGLLLKHIQEMPAPFKKIRPDLNIPPELEAIVMKTLAKQPDDRYTMVSDLAANLDACFRHMTTGVFSVASANTVQNRAPGAVPTEVVPGQGPAPSGLNDLRPPNAVPAGLSTSLPVSGAPRLSEFPAPGTGAVPTMQGAMPGQGSPTAMPTSPMAMPTGATYAAPAQAGFGSSVTPTGMTHPVPGVGVETLGGVLGEQSQVIRPPAAGASKKILAGAAVAAALAGVVWYATQKGGSTVAATAVIEPTPVVDPTPPPAPTPPAPTPPVVAEAEPPDRVPAPAPAPSKGKTKPQDKAPQPAATKVTFRFDSTPSGAVVELDGSQIGRTPFTREFAKGHDPAFFVFKLEGYEPAKQSATLMADRTIHAQLAQAKPAAAAPPATPVKDVASSKPDHQPKVPPPPPPPAKKPDDDFDKVGDLKDDF